MRPALREMVNLISTKFNGPMDLLDLDKGTAAVMVRPLLGSRDRDPSKQLEVPTGELLIVRERGDLGNPGNRDIPPALGRCTQTRKAVAEEASEELRKPPGPV